MEISNEIKAKVFAQYLGQRILVKSLTNYTCDLVLNNPYNDHRNGMELKSAIFNNAILILKPLSQISDEDAIEVAHIGYGVERKQKINENKDRYIKNVKIYFLNNPTAFVYQFLQSKGYDLPNYYLDGKTLFESNLAIYE